MYPASPYEYRDAIYGAPWTNFGHGPGYRKATNHYGSTAGIAGARRAHGMLDCKAKAAITDGWVLTLTGDNGDAVDFEWDVVGDGVAGGNVQVNISAITTADEVATALAAAIAGSHVRIAVVSQDGARLYLLNLGTGLGTRVVDDDGSLASWHGMSDEYGTGSFVSGSWRSEGYDGDGFVPVRWGVCRGVAPDSTSVS